MWHLNITVGTELFILLFTHWPIIEELVHSNKPCLLLKCLSSFYCYWQGHIPRLHFIMPTCPMTVQQCPEVKALRVQQCPEVTALRVQQCHTQKTAYVRQDHSGEWKKQSTCGWYTGTYWRLPMLDRTPVPRACSAPSSEKYEGSSGLMEQPCKNSCGPRWRTWRLQPSAKPPDWPSEAELRLNAKEEEGTWWCIFHGWWQR